MSHFPLGSQHPAHVPGPHGCATHAPLTHDAPDAVQFWHVAPPVPQASPCPPSPQTPPWQHPVHVTGPQVASHDPFTHWLPVAHVWHWLPASPHVLVVVPPKHVLPEQQPEQFDGPHDAFVWHEPTAHCVPGPHEVHAAPPEPHAESFVPGRQRFPSQQPPGQVLALHAPAVWQTLATHVAVFPQSWHPPPPEPQALSAPPPVHVFDSQHPAHDCGPHTVGVVQIPPAQTSLVGHDAHDAPPPPQAPTLVPDWQRPFLSQQPGQFCELHPVATQTPPLPGPAGAHCEPVHASHACPPVPHAVTSVPVVHPVALQQPAQFVPLHDELAQTPPPWAPEAQLSPFPHASHALPFAPHAESSVPAKQFALTQQPAHAPHDDGGMHAPVAGSHVSPAGQLHEGGIATHVPPAPASAFPPLAWHVAGMFARVQSAHSPPPPPHACIAVPGAHTPSAQQPVGQVEGLHSTPESPGTNVKLSP